MIVASLSSSSVEHMIHILVYWLRVNGVPRGSRNKHMGNISMYFTP